MRSAARSSSRKRLAKSESRGPAFEKISDRSLIVIAVGQARRWLLLAVIIAIAPNPLRCASDTDDLCQLFQVDLPAADIVILLDASLSMKDHQYDDVRRAVIDFVPALTDKENLHLRVFGDTVSNGLEGKSSEVVGSIEGYLPKAPLFNHTDLGLAILKGLDFLERDGASNVQAFFLLTDGLHEPPDDSPFSRDFANDPNWQALQHRARSLCQQRRIYVYGIGLAQQTDITVLRQVFPAQNVEVMVGNASQVARTLQRVRERLRHIQLRQALEQELTEGRIEVNLAKNSIDDGASFELPIIIRNAYRHLTVRIERVEVQRIGSASREIECALEGFPADEALEPGEELQAIVRGRLRAAPPGWRIGKATQFFETAFEFAPVARFQAQAALDELAAGLSPRTLDASSLAVSLRLSYGIPYGVVIGAALMIASIAGMIGVKVKRVKRQQVEIKQRRAERRRLAGTLKIWRTQQAEPEGNGIDLSRYGEEKLELVMVEDDRLEVILPGDQPGKVVARLSGDWIGDWSDDGALEKPEFHVEPTIGHQLAYESRGEMRQAATLTLCANDVLEIDGKWRMRYANEKLRTRAEFESAQTGGL